MRKLPAMLLAGLAAFPVLAHAQAAAPTPTPAWTWANKVSLYSEYEYRGISQTSEDPALQYNGDLSHASGFYAGTFITNIKWLKDYVDIGAARKKASVEVDLFAGYKFEVLKDVVMDVGYLRYQYPGHEGIFGSPKANTDEVYVGAAFGPVSAKYSYAFSDAFGVTNSEGSDFLELNVAYPLIDKVTLTAHVGHQKFKNNKALDYTVYKIGGAYDLGSGWTVGGYYKDTDADPVAYTVKGKDWGKGRLVGFVSYAF